MGSASEPWERPERRTLGEVLAPVKREGEQDRPANDRQAADDPADQRAEAPRGKRGDHDEGGRQQELPATASQGGSYGSWRATRCSSQRCSDDQAPIRRSMEKTMHGRFLTFPASLRATLLSALLALFALPAAAWAGVAEVRFSTEEQPKANPADVWFLSYAGGDESNVVSVRVVPSDPAGGEGMMVLTDAAGATPGRGCTRLDPTDATTVICGDRKSSITAPSIELGGGDDSFTFADGTETFDRAPQVDGGPGNDVLHIGDGGGILRGGPGDDQLFGGAGYDSFYEGDSANGSDTIVGNSSQGPWISDTVNYRDRRNGVVVDLAHPQLHDSGEPGENDTISGIDWVQGGNGDDRLIADDLGDRLDGGAGDDTIVGGRGDDTTYSGDGADSISGGEGVDTIDAGDANDRIDGGADEDLIDGSRGDDTIVGGRGEDRIYGSAGIDHIDARDRSTDLIVCGAGSDHPRLDALDAPNDTCENFHRATPRASLEDLSRDDYSRAFPAMAAKVICPSDVQPVCQVDVTVRRGHQLVATATGRAGTGNFVYGSYLRLHFTPRGRHLLRRAHRTPVPVRVRVTTHPVHGRPRSIVTDELLDDRD